MPKRNHIKAKGAQGISLRGIGKLGWTESGTTLSTQRRLSATFNDEEKELPHLPKHLPKKRCPKCLKKVKIKNGKFMKHNRCWFRTRGDYDRSFYICCNSDKPV